MMPRTRVEAGLLVGTLLCLLYAATRAYETAGRINAREAVEPRPHVVEACVVLCEAAAMSAHLRHEDGKWRCFCDPYTCPAEAGEEVP